jgi:hypothetical protein
MTPSEDLSPEARNLLRTAKNCDRASPNEVSRSVERFLQYRAHSGRARQNTWFPFTKQRVAPWAVVAGIFSATLGAYATVGQSFGLPVPRWWSENATWTSLDTTTSEPPNVTHIGLNDSSGTGARGGAQRSKAAEELRVNDTELVPRAATATLVTPNVVALDVSSTPATEVQRPVATAPEPPSPAAKPSVERVSVAATPQARTKGSSLTREIQSITAARDALDAGNCALAVRHLDDHRATFPQGALREERQALTAICQCRTGADTTAAQSYLGARADSPLTRRVAKECGITRNP